jgi:hypothetical protein
MYGPRPVPFDDGLSVVSRVAIERVHSYFCSPAMGEGERLIKIKNPPGFPLAGFS